MKLKFGRLLLAPTVLIVFLAVLVGSAKADSVTYIVTTTDPDSDFTYVSAAGFLSLNTTIFPPTPGAFGELGTTGAITEVCFCLYVTGPTIYIESAMMVTPANFTFDQTYSLDSIGTQILTSGGSPEATLTICYTGNCSVMPTPEPLSGLLLGIGFLGLMVMALSRSNFFLGQAQSQIN